MNCSDGVFWDYFFWIFIVSLASMKMRRKYLLRDRGSTTAITFCVNSYREFAGEALVALNFSKNIFHGLAFSLFITGWIQTDGSKIVYIWIGIIHLLAMFSTLPLFIFLGRGRGIGRQNKRSMKGLRLLTRKGEKM